MTLIIVKLFSEYLAGRMRWWRRCLRTVTTDAAFAVSDFLTRIRAFHV